ncbi:hypothetical protein AcV5_009501 [Taiwanofungus camphoratus]|nr:hypothetical protein AcV5_009501 [Antrodia cinnamomea]
MLIEETEVLASPTVPGSMTADIETVPPDGIYPQYTTLTADGTVSTSVPVYGHTWAHRDVSNISRTHKKRRAVEQRSVSDLENASTPSSLPVGSSPAVIVASPSALHTAFLPPGMPWGTSKSHSPGPSSMSSRSSSSQSWNSASASSRASGSDGTGISTLRPSIGSTASLRSSSSNAAGWFSATRPAQTSSTSPVLSSTTSLPPEYSVSTSQSGTGPVATLNILLTSSLESWANTTLSVSLFGPSNNDTLSSEQTPSILVTDSQTITLSASSSPPATVSPTKTSLAGPLPSNTRPASQIAKTGLIGAVAAAGALLFVLMVVGFLWRLRRRRAPRALDVTPFEFASPITEQLPVNSLEQWKTLDDVVADLDGAEAPNIVTPDNQPSGIVAQSVQEYDLVEASSVRRPYMHPAIALSHVTDPLGRSHSLQSRSYLINLGPDLPLSHTDSGLLPRGPIRMDQHSQRRSMDGGICLAGGPLTPAPAYEVTAMSLSDQGTLPPAYEDRG